MSSTMETTKEDKNEKSSFIKWLTEDDSPEIGIASKEPLMDYFRGVQFEFNKIVWPTKEQLKNEFFTVIVIVAIISALVFIIDLGLARFISTIKGS